MWKTFRFKASITVVQFGIENSQFSNFRLNHLQSSELFIVVVAVQNMININELDPIRRYLPAAERPRPSSRYSSFQVGTSALVLTTN